jgi:hypothetical protein
MELQFQTSPSNMKQITIIHPTANTEHTFTNEESLRDFLNNDVYSFKDSRLFKLQSAIRPARVGQIPEILDMFKIDYRE